MNFENYNLTKYHTFDDRRKSFLIGISLATVTTAFKFIEGAFINHLSVLEIIVNLAFGLGLIGLFVLLIERAK